MRKRWLWAAAGLAVGFLAGWGVARMSEAPPVRGAAAAAETPERRPATPAAAEMELAGRPSVGPADAPVTMVEFTDFQCPYCARHHRRTKAALLEAFEGRLRYVVRHFPLETVHPRARAAARAAECAHRQDAFWAYADLLYERSPAFEPASLAAYAAELDLDADRFERCLDGEEAEEAVAADIAAARRLGVRSTPTFFLNGRRVLGAKPLAEFRGLVEEALRGAE